MIGKNTYTEQDKFERKEFIKEIEKELSIIRKIGGVVAIHSSFGTGKTFFCNIYKEYLNGEEHSLSSPTFSKRHAHIIDAFLHDYVSDPFLAIHQSIEKVVKNEGQTKIDRFKDFVKDFSKRFLIFGAKNIPFVSQYIGEPLSEVIKGVAYTPTGLEGARDEYIEELKSCTKNREFTIFIDELDRCRPHYALLFLERLKHYFDKVPNLLFVLMIDKDELFATIKHLYGINYPHRYFEKFLSTFIINLPDKPLHSNEPPNMDMHYRKVLIKSIIEAKGNIKDMHTKIELAGFIFWVLDCNNYRDQNKIVEMTDFGTDKLYLLSLHLLLRILKDNYPEIFIKLKNKELEAYYMVYGLFSKLPDDNAVVNIQIPPEIIYTIRNLRDLFKTFDNNEFWEKNRRLFLAEYSLNTELLTDFISEECLAVEKPIATIYPN